MRNCREASTIATITGTMMPYTQIPPASAGPGRTWKSWVGDDHLVVRIE